MSQTTDTVVVEIALDAVAQSQARVRETSRLLSETRYRIASCRRHLNPAFAIAGGVHDYDRLHELVQARLERGTLLPITGPRSWAGSGSGNPCAVCYAPIGGAEVEYEVASADGGPWIAHLICYMIWSRESEALLKTP